jgi:DNA polymerase-3 subunit gamma/tau
VSGPLASAPTLASADWESFLRAVEQQSPGIYGTLALAKPITFGRDGITLGFSAGSLSLAEVRKSDIERLAAKALGIDRVGVTLRAVEGAEAAAPASLDETQRIRADEERDRRRREARSHPTVSAALEVFEGANIKDVKVDLD